MLSNNVRETRENRLKALYQWWTENYIASATTEMALGALTKEAQRVFGCTEKTARDYAKVVQSRYK